MNAKENERFLSVVNMTIFLYKYDCYADNYIHILDFDSQVSYTLDYHNHCITWQTKTLPLYLFVVVNCGDPGTPTNGTITGSTFTFPNTVTYTCNVGFNLIGNRSRRCLSGGQWSGGLPTCQSKYIHTLDKMYRLMASMEGSYVIR